MPTRCAGCGAVFPDMQGPTHAYMQSSPACFAAFTKLLAAEYSSAALRSVHRLTVDTWAVQHPGSAEDRRAIQSVGLHLARLMLQLERPGSPMQTNAVMLDFARYKGTLRRLAPPETFRVTVADVVDFAGTPSHADKVRQWAETTWEGYAEHHEYIRRWIDDKSRR